MAKSKKTKKLDNQVSDEDLKKASGGNKELLEKAYPLSMKDAKMMSRIIQAVQKNPGHASDILKSVIDQF